MKPCFCFINGPLKDLYFPAKEDLVFGRTTGNVLIEDSSVSSKHARVTGKEGRFYLADLNSKNGTFINGRKIKEHHLKINDTITFGTVEVRFKLVSEQVVSHINELTCIFPNYTSWKSKFIKFIESYQKKLKNEKKTIKPFTKPIILNCISGLQYGEQWTLSYGPRNFGPESLEFPIYEEDLPNVCFTLKNHTKGIEFSTMFPETTKLNQKSQKTKILQQDDTISIKDTQFKVEFFDHTQFIEGL